MDRISDSKIHTYFALIAQGFLPSPNSWQRNVHNVMLNKNRGLSPPNSKILQMVSLSFGSLLNL